MLYREAAPAGPAGEFVKCFWMLEDDHPSSDVQRILPDGRCELILNFGDSFESYSNNGWAAQPRRFVTGQITGPMLLRGRGKTNILGIRFHPHGASQYLGMPISELTDRAASLDELSVRAAREFEKLDDLPSTAEQFGALDPWLRRARSGRKPIGPLPQPSGYSSRHTDYILLKRWPSSPD